MLAVSGVGDNFRCQSKGVALCALVHPGRRRSVATILRPFKQMVRRISCVMIIGQRRSVDSDSDF